MSHQSNQSATWMTSRRYIFTINNPKFTGPDLLTVIKDENWALFTVLQLELGTGTGTIHLQGWVVWTTPIRVTQCRGRLGGSAHVEPQLGSDIEAYAYATKEDTRQDGPWELGPRPSGRGFREDIAGIRRDVLAGRSDRHLVEQYFGTYLRFHRGIAAARLALPVRRGSDPPTINIFWGVTGTGKTRRAFQEAGEDAFWMMHGCWFDGYNQEESVIIDDFYGWLPWSQLLRILDRYPVRVPIKGGSTRWCPTTIWITSNQDPRSWYNYREGMEWETLRRRITNIVHFDESIFYQSPQAILAQE